MSFWSTQNERERERGQKKILVLSLLLISFIASSFSLLLLLRCQLQIDSFTCLVTEQMCVCVCGRTHWFLNWLYNVFSLTIRNKRHTHTHTHTHTLYCIQLFQILDEFRRHHLPLSRFFLLCDTSSGTFLRVIRTDREIWTTSFILLRQWHVNMSWLSYFLRLFMTINSILFVIVSMNKRRTLNERRAL